MAGDSVSADIVYSCSDGVTFSSTPTLGDKARDYLLSSAGQETMRRVGEPEGMTEDERLSYKAWLRAMGLEEA